MALRSALFRGDARLEAAATSPNSHITPGSRGPHVAKLQKALNILDNASLQEDGAYGSATAAAVLAFKKKRAIVNTSYQTQPDNIVGVMTMAALDEELAAEPEPDHREFEEYRQLYNTALSLLSSQKGDTSRARAFFIRQKPLLDKMALGGHRIPANSLVARSLVASPGIGAPIGAIQVAVVLVAVLLVILVFAAAMAIVNAQNSNATAQEIARLEREFQIRINELNRIISEAPAQIIILIASMVVTIETAIRNQINDLKRQMERCRQLSDPLKMTKCLAKFDRVVDLMQDMISRAILQGFENEKKRALLLLGLARSMGNLMLFISDWARCMGCQFLVFF
jgi:peptidoglycan hydrolase-like protein with peptidoglycan-binding domain